VRVVGTIRKELCRKAFWFVYMMGTKGQGNQRCCLGMLRSLNAASRGSNGLAFWFACLKGIIRDELCTNGLAYWIGCLKGIIRDELCTNGLAFWIGCLKGIIRDELCTNGLAFWIGCLKGIIRDELCTNGLAFWIRCVMGTKGISYAPMDLLSGLSGLGA